MGRGASTTSTAKSTKEGGFVCPYCKGTFSFRMHRYNCEQYPFDVWLRQALKKRRRGLTPQQIELWTEKCAHCESKIEHSNAARHHETFCRHRRLQSGLRVSLWRQTRGPVWKIVTPAMDLQRTVINNIVWLKSVPDRRERALWPEGLRDGRLAQRSRSTTGECYSFQRQRRCKWWRKRGAEDGSRARKAVRSKAESKSWEGLRRYTKGRYTRWRIGAVGRCFSKRPKCRRRQWTYGTKS